MKILEPTTIDSSRIAELKKLVARGEGSYLEFKRKAAFPEKVIKEIIAFANTDGGTLLIGVDDDGELAGVKYPEEEILSIEQALAKHCRPAVSVQKEIIGLTTKKFIVRIDVSRSEQRPHRLVVKEKEASESSDDVYVRYQDMSVKASREMKEIVRRSKQGKDIKFTYGQHESTLIKYLEENGKITLSQFRKLTKLNRFMASRKLVTLVLAHVLKITPAQPDLYSRI